MLENRDGGGGRGCFAYVVLVKIPSLPSLSLTLDG